MRPIINSVLHLLSLASGLAVGWWMSVTWAEFVPFMGTLLAAGFLFGLRKKKFRVAVVLAAVGVSIPVGTALFVLQPPLEFDIGPLDYQDMTVPDMTRDLHDTWKMRVTRYPRSSEEEAAREPRYDFRTTRPQPWREVLQRLADETDHDLGVFVCGSGATLRGPNYYTATLYLRDRPKAPTAPPKMEGSGSTPESDLRVSPDPSTR